MRMRDEMVAVWVRSADSRPSRKKRREGRPQEIKTPDWIRRRRPGRGNREITPSKRGRKEDGHHVAYRPDCGRRWDLVGGKHGEGGEGGNHAHHRHADRV